MTFRNRLQYFVVKFLRISNKEAVQLFLAHKILLNGKVAAANDLLFPEDEVVFDWNIIKPKTLYTYIAYHKPVGVESTLNTDIEHNLVQALGLSVRLFPVGRLDKASEGLMLLTNNGKIVNKILNENQEKEKEYEVEVNRTLGLDFLDALRNGMVIMGQLTKPAKVVAFADTKFSIILTQGLNRQIRRMCYQYDYEVLVLKRIRITAITLGDLTPGAWRYLSEEEVKALWH
jgi:23S rRNA pseudouridine2604 synthase